MADPAGRPWGVDRLSGRTWAATRPVRRTGAPVGPEQGSAACAGRAPAPWCLPKPAATARAHQPGAAPRDRPEPARSSPAVGFWTAWPKLNTKQPTGPLRPLSLSPSGARTRARQQSRSPAAQAAATDLAHAKKPALGQSRDRGTLSEFQFPEYTDLTYTSIFLPHPPLLGIMFRSIDHELSRRKHPPPATRKVPI